MVTFICIYISFKPQVYKFTAIYDVPILNTDGNKCSLSEYKIKKIHFL